MNSPQPSPVSVPTPLPSPEVTLVDDTTFNSLLESIETHSQNESSDTQQLIELEKEKLQLMRDRSLKRNEERDPDADFFKSILPQIKQMTERNKVKFRIKVLELLDTLLSCLSTAAASDVLFALPVTRYRTKLRDLEH
ncbi:hypothetical protein M8J77_006461 [Diaphorina citri]|nr:hypothetical protein M8J77_006461 [Diaphorina citri]